MSRLDWAYELAQMAPPWLRRTRGAQFLGAIGDVINDVVDATARGVLARFPGRIATATDSLAYSGRDRVIVRGPNETDDAYALRLTRWWEDHQHRGGPYAMMEQLRAYYTGVAIKIELIYNSGARWTMDNTGGLGTITADSISWNGGGDPTKWAQAWMIFHVNSSGTVATNDDAISILAVPRQWNAAHVLPIRIVMLWNGVRLWGYPTGVKWGDPGLTWGSPEIVNDLFPLV